MSKEPFLRCDVRLRLQSELDALSRAVRKANDILGMPTDSPDTLRRRRNSIQRWNEVYSAAYTRLEKHTREHGCGEVELIPFRGVS